MINVFANTLFQHFSWARPSQTGDPSLISIRCNAGLKGQVVLTGIDTIEHLAGSKGFILVEVPEGTLGSVGCSAGSWLRVPAFRQVACIDGTVIKF